MRVGARSQGVSNVVAVNADGAMQEGHRSGARLGLFVVPRVG
jgi:hypothetical protein